MTPRILVIGDSMLDRYWHGTVERMSAEAPVPVLRIDRQESRLGGAANVALNCRTLGCEVALITCAGTDAAGEELCELADRQGIMIAASCDSELQTTVKVRAVDHSKQLMRADFESWPSADVQARMLRDFERLLPDTDIVVLSDYAKGALARSQEFIDLARAFDVRVLVDPKDPTFDRYEGAWLVKPNEAELSIAVRGWDDEAEMIRRAEQLRSSRFKHLLVTRGPAGMVLFSKGVAQNLPTEAREVFDVCGAGDTVIATLAAMLARGMDLLPAVRLANRAAGIVVGRFGTSSVTAAELEIT
jgi:rfaE bifunctional protein kinase chain/domain